MRTVYLPLSLDLVLQLLLRVHTHTYTRARRRRRGSRAHAFCFRSCCTRTSRTLGDTIVCARDMCGRNWLELVPTTFSSPSVRNYLALIAAEKRFFANALPLNNVGRWRAGDGVSYRRLSKLCDSCRDVGIIVSRLLFGPRFTTTHSRSLAQKSEGCFIIYIGRQIVMQHNTYNLFLFFATTDEYWRISLTLWSFLKSMLIIRSTK